MTVISGLSGNELYCLQQQGFCAGDVVVGNSVYSLGLIGSISSGLRAVIGGELEQVTQLIAEGREQAYNRLMAEVQARQGSGVTGVSSELVFHRGNVEFLSIGSVIHTLTPNSNPSLAINHDTNINHGVFSSSADGQELFAQIDAGYQPISFVFGNVAYSMGIARGILGGFKTLARGEIKEFSHIFNHTRHLALERIINQAKKNNANAVMGIKTSILPCCGVNEMMMIGTAARNTQLADNEVVTSSLSNLEMWSLAKLGYVPQKLLLGTSIYSLGLIGSITSLFKTFVRGEIPELSKLIYAARENALSILKQEAEHIQADDVLGVKTYVYNLGSGLVEFLAIGTAVRKVENFKTFSDQLPPQAMMEQKKSFFDTTVLAHGIGLNEGK